MEVHREGFRFTPPPLRDGLLTRPRLLGELRGRFDRRLTVVRGGPGFGKTTLLAQAVEDNQLDRVGLDVWVHLIDSDRRPEHFVGSVLDGLDVALRRSTGRTRGAEELLVDELWAMAPSAVAIMLDDAHVLAGSPSEALIARWCETLPKNAHLVLGTRPQLSLPLRTMQARGEAWVVEEAALAFTPEEQLDFAERHQLAMSPDELVPTWPAMASLMSSVGHAASIEFLWEAVLGSLSADRRRSLAMLVGLDTLDDELASAVLGEPVSVTAMCEGLPLVDVRNGEVRFHDLWRRALDSEVDDERRSGYAAAAEVLVWRGEIVRAVRCLRAVNDWSGIERIARSFGASPIASRLSAPVAEVILDCLPLAQRNGPLGQYLHVLRTSGFQSDRIVGDLRSIVETAVAAGDHDVATMALWRLTQLLGDVDPGHLVILGESDVFTLIDRFAADGWPHAANASHLIRSHECERAHDIAGALAAAECFGGADPAVVQSSRWSRYVALGHPERVDASLDAVLADGVSDAVSAHALWLRGEVDPTVAWSIVQDLPVVYGERGLPHVQVPLLGVLTGVALAAGDLAGAERCVQQALSESRRSMPRTGLFARLASVLLTLARDGDEPAREELASITGEIPVEPWPSWAYIGSLCAVRVLLEDSDWLDSLEVGPSIAVAVQAGRAIRDLRERASVEAARSLPWHSQTLLRVQVPPSLLVELALAVGAREPAAMRCLESIPGRANWEQRLIDHPADEVRSAARSLWSARAVRPAYDLEVITLGEFRMRRSDGVPVSERVRGGRVQQLVAALLMDESSLRTELAARIWPDLDDKQAATNLRVTLNVLLDSVEPDRRAGASWFIRTVESRLGLVADGVTVDVRRFEQAARAARDAERSTRLADALGHHRRALELYSGDFLPGLEDPDVVRERWRLQSLAYGSGCRAAELLLAKGEPEESLEVLRRAGRLDPFGERSRRAEVRCHLALGSRSAAQEAARRLHDLLTEAGLPMESETLQLLHRLEIPVALRGDRRR